MHAALLVANEEIRPAAAERGDRGAALMLAKIRRLTANVQEQRIRETRRGVGAGVA